MCVCASVLFLCVFALFYRKPKHFMHVFIFFCFNGVYKEDNYGILMPLPEYCFSRSNDGCYWAVLKIKILSLIKVIVLTLPAYVFHTNSFLTIRTWIRFCRLIKNIFFFMKFRGVKILIKNIILKNASQ